MTQIGHLSLIPNAFNQLGQYTQQSWSHGFFPGSEHCNVSSRFCGYFYSTSNQNTAISYCANAIAHTRKKLCKKTETNDTLQDNPAVWNNVRHYSPGLQIDPAP